MHTGQSQKQSETRRVEGPAHISRKQLQADGRAVVNLHTAPVIEMRVCSVDGRL